MGKISKEDICFIRPKIDANDYYFRGIERMGYKILVPYKGNGLVLRVMREAWFRFGLPNVRTWYNDELNKIDPKVFIVRDSLITNEFLMWLREHHPKARIIMDYDNLASTTLDPDSIQDKTVEKWSYDADDCKRYGMKMKPLSFLDVYRVSEKETPEYDVLYLGRDKGRLGYLLDLEEQIRQQGLRPYFHICADRRFQRFKNRHYKGLMTYESYIGLMKKSRAILNVVTKPQKSMTMRDMEVLFNGIKGITNNSSAVDFPLYDPSRFFVVGVDDMDSLPAFLETPFRPVDEKELDLFKYEKAIDQMVNGNEDNRV